MDTEKIKEIWKENAVKQIDNYTDSEIKSILLKNARKAIDASYPGIGFILFHVALVLFCMWLGWKYASDTLQVFWAVCIVVLLGGISVSVSSRRKMRKYSPDVSLKDWIEARICEFDRSINRKKMYWFGMTYGLGLLFLILFCIILMWFANFTLKGIVVPFVTGLICMIISSEIAKRVIIRRMTKSRKRLQELYNQLQNTELN